MVIPDHPIIGIVAVCVLAYFIVGLSLATNAACAGISWRGFFRALFFGPLILLLLEAWKRKQ